MRQSAADFKKIVDRYLAGKSSPAEKAAVEHWFEKGGDTGKPDLYLSEAAQTGLLHQIHQRQQEQVEQPALPVVAGKRNILFRANWQAAAIWTGILLVISLLIVRTGEHPVVFAEIKTGTGEIKKIVLPDSSIVWINANSVVSYHPDFAHHRELRLSGEALFTVMQDPQHPFTVATEEGLYTKVLGTEFNIRNYRQSGDMSITVLSGKVQISKADTAIGILTKQQALYYSKVTHQFTRNTTAHPGTGAAWTRGVWEYENFSFDDLALLLQNQYGITVRDRRAGSAQLQTNISVNFTKQQRAIDILDFFCSLTGCRYKKNHAGEMELYSSQ
jgi:ferric-dicitrate binding protein FerR (iron transport regulator)